MCESLKFMNTRHLPFLAQRCFMCFKSLDLQSFCPLRVPVSRLKVYKYCLENFTKLNLNGDQSLKCFCLVDVTR